MAFLTQGLKCLGGLGWSGWRALLGVFFLSCGLAGPAVSGASARPTDYEVIATYLPVFLRYVQWPDNTPLQPGTPLRIGVLGRDPFGPALERAILDRTVNGRRIEMQRDTSAEKLLECQIVFINLTGPERSKALGLLSGRPILTVVYVNDRAVPSDAAAIQFVLSGTNVRYLLNTSVLQGSGLRATQGLIENALRKSEPGLAEFGKGRGAP